MIVNFDVYVDTKVLEGNWGEVCSGLIFRQAHEGWDEGAYIFSVCNDSHFEVDYHGPNGWEDITDWKYTDVIRNSDWNRIQVSARDEHFILSINNVDVLEMEDDRQTIGGLAIFITVREKNPAVVWFDNFGYQTR